jgi:hypothetical protein
MFVNDESDFMPDYLDLLQASRKLGYTTCSAIADICDNPFDAGADKTWVEIIKSDDNKVNGIIISDNGKGMTKYELSKALVPASTGRTRQVQNELGFFGVGLIASGLHLGNRIEIFTRGAEGDFYSYIDWDEKCVTNNPVNVVRPCTRDESTTILSSRIRNNATGTVIWVSKINIAHTKYDDLIQSLEFHLGVTYYNLRDKYQLFINNNPVLPWDLLEVGNAHNTSPVFEYPVKKYINGKHIDAVIKLQFSYLKKENRARPHEFYGTTDDNQAGALERNGRTLAFGQWMVKRKNSSAYNGLRFRVSYDNTDLDELIFQINVQKDGCSIIDDGFYKWLNKHIQDYWRVEGSPLYEKYRNRQKPGVQKTSGKKLPVAMERILFMAEHKLTKRLNSVNPDTMSAEKALQMLQELRTLAVDVETEAKKARALKQSLSAHG